MELKRVMGRLAPRWPVLIIAGLIGAIAAFVFVNQRNSEVEPVYSAEAVVALPSTTDEADDGRGPANAVSGELNTALELAKTVNEPELRRDNRFVEADGETNSLIFEAIETTEEAAINAAQAMRQAYVDEDPAFDVNEELEKIEKPAGISNPKDFRNEIVNFVLRAKANNAGRNPDWRSYEKLRTVIEKKMFSNTEDLLPVISFNAKASAQDKKKHQDFVQRMIERGYTEKQVRLLSEWYLRVRKSQ